MATNFFFNNFQASGEQNLLENLIIESIRIYGHDVYYIPRKLNNQDPLYNEDDNSSYEAAYPIEMYIKSVDGFGGDGNFMSKFGVEIRDQVVFSMAQRTFQEEVGTHTGQSRPGEGDLIYFPLNRKCFQITYTNKFEMFYQLGALQTWEVTTEVFEFSSETVNTGIPEIDALANYSMDVLDWALLDESGAPMKDENGDYIVLEGFDIEIIAPGSSNEDIQKESDEFLDWTVVDPFSEGNI